MTWIDQSFLCSKKGRLNDKCFVCWSLLLFINHLLKCMIWEWWLKQLAKPCIVTEREPGMVHWWEYLPPTTVTTCGLSLFFVCGFALRVFCLGHQVFLPPQKLTFQIPIWPGTCGREEPLCGMSTVVSNYYYYHYHYHYRYRYRYRYRYHCHCHCHYHYYYHYHYHCH